jgi:Transposase DDE domain
MRVEEEVQIDISKLHTLQQFSAFFKRGQIEQLAKQSGFIVRSSSRLSGAAFLDMMVQYIAPQGEWSLNDQCDYLQEHHGIELTKQSLDERYHTFAVAFLKSCYQTVLAQAFHDTVEGITTPFKGIYLTDSTVVQLPSQLAAFYQSTATGAAAGSRASIKIHQTIELLKFQIHDFLLTDGRKGDASYWKNKHFELSDNNLWIADLGYFSWDTLTQVAENNYFLCRYKTGAALYLKDQAGQEQPLDLQAYLQQQDGAAGMHSLEVYIGKEDDRIKARLLFERVPEEVLQQRLERCRKAQAQTSQKQKHWQISALREFLCGYNLYLTNADAAKLPDEVVRLIYSLRWQIELLFKIWKSLLLIEHTKGMNIFRFECFLYGRLIFILLSTELLSFIRSTLQQAAIEVELSEWKTLKLIKKKPLPC